MFSRSDFQEETELLSSLVRIDSSNPGLGVEGAGESRIADFVAGWLRLRGFDCYRIEPEPGRPSIVAVRKGTGGGKSIMLNGHLDTVTLAGYEGDPLDPVVADGRLYGRGAFDMKAGVAAIMLAAADLASTQHRGDLLVALVADEEHLSTGTESVLAEFRADSAIVVESTNQALITAHKGFVWIEVLIFGKAAHGALREEGVDAIVKAGRFLTALGELDHQYSLKKPHGLLGTTSFHSSTIHGGEEFSSYPAKCAIELEVRTLPGEDPSKIRTEIQTILERLAETDVELRFEVKEVFHRSPFEVDLEEPIVRAVQDAGEAVSKRSPDVQGAPYWTDCALMTDAGIPCVLFGPSGGGAHASTEWADIASVAEVRDVLRLAASRVME